MDVVLYSNGCPRCNILHKKLDAKNIGYTENGDVDYMMSIGIKDVPMLCVDGEMLDFKAANDWVNDQNANT